jgi:ABC-type multidrug transport system ATPase subunit
VWDKLAEIAGGTARKRTVFVTTHYMDEAERCDDVVILDHGRLLARGNPGELCERTGTKRLEDAFVSLTGHDIRDAGDEEAGGMSAMKSRLRMRGRG